MFKKAIDPSMQPILDKVMNTSYPQTYQTSVSEQLQAGTTVNPQDPKLIVDTLDKIPETELTKEEKESVKANPEAIQYLQQQIPSVSAPGVTASYSMNTRELLYDLNKRYNIEDLNLVEALKIWKQAKLTPEMIRDQIRDDVQKNISLAEAKILYKVGSDLLLDNNKLFIDINNNNEKIMKDIKSLKLTSTIRSNIERVGKNLFRTKNANILWKIDMRQMDDGKQVPYLIRVDAVEANEDDSGNRI